MADKNPRRKDRALDKVEVTAIDILSVTVSGDGRSMANVLISLDAGEHLQISLTPVMLAKLEGMLSQAALEQAKVQHIH